MLLCMGWSLFLIPSLAHNLIPELGLSHMQFTLIFAAPILIAAFSAILGGAVADRYGIRLIAAIAIFLAGVVGLARAFTPNFVGMLALMCLLGIPLGALIPNLPKLVSNWFPPRQAGLASGIYMSALGIGSSLGLVTGPLFASWRSAFIYIGILTLVAAILWALLARNAPAGVVIGSPPIVSTMKRALRSKNIWLLAGSQCLLFGGFICFSQNFPKAIETIHHIDPVSAGAITSLVTWGMAAGHLVFPLLSDRIGLRKPFVYGGALTSAACLFFAWQLAPGGATGALIFLAGFLFGGIPPILLTVPVELPEIGQEYVGGAAGVMVSLMYLGGFLIPLVVSPVFAAATLVSYNTGFLLVSLLFTGIILPVIFIAETGGRVKEAS